MNPSAAILLTLLTVLHANAASEPRTHAMWVYKTDEVMADPKEQAQLFEFCASRRIVDLFWQMRFTPAPGATQDGPLLVQNAVALRAFLHEANAHGLRIHALSGDPSFTEPTRHQRALARVDSIVEFNRTATSDRFSGIHFDIEPHGLKAWRSASVEQRSLLLTHLVEVCAIAADRAHGAVPPMQFGADITFWFDKSKPDGSPVYPVTFHGKTKDATKHLLDFADNVGIMSYRNTAEGKNGIVSLVRQTIEYADTAKGRAFVGVKVSPIGAAMESFFGVTEEQMMQALKPIDTTYSSHRGYAGLAFFMYEAYRLMPHSSQ